ncbi:MAG: oxidoreductase [Myxococcaceae bacterium]|nr:oxidoreductase [Myxococcaceae bacterium]
MDLELFYEFGSQYSYLSVMLAEQAAKARGLSIAYRPFLLGPIFAAQGYSQPPFKQFPIKGEYVWRDIERLCADAGLNFRRPTSFPRKGVLAARVALVGLDEGWGLAFSRRVYQLNFVEDREIEDEANIREVLAGLSLSADTVLARALAPDNRERLKLQTQRAQDLGIFGAPTFVVGRELFWGQDRMQQALEWASRAREQAP